jgi:hypothetical protein
MTIVAQVPLLRGLGGINPPFPNEFNASAWCNWLASFGTEIAARFVDIALNDQETATSWAVVHPAGFIRVELVEWRDSQLWLHLFSCEEAKDEEVHDHRRSLASRVLAGSITERRYDLEVGRQDCHQTPTYMLNCFPQDINGDRLLEIGHACAVVLRSQVERRTGETYSIAAGEFHSAVARSGFAATLVLAGCPSRTSARVVRSSMDAGGRLALRRPSATRLQHLAELLSRSLQCQPRSEFGPSL